MLALLFVRSGTMRLKNSMKRMPHTASTAPTGVKSNMVKLSPVISSRSRETTMFGEVPIWVIRPPRRAANAMGIRNFEAGVPDFLANWKASGIMMASAPIFLMKAESTATETSRSASWARFDVRVGKKRLTARLTMPERATAALTISALPTMMTMSSLKPENALSKGTMPSASARSSEQQATRS